MKEPGKKPREQRSALEEKLDEEIEESFPASDPPSNTRTFVGGPRRSRPKSEAPRPPKGRG